MSGSNVDSIEAAAAAEFVDFLGVRLPGRFGPIEREWRAVRHGAGLLDARNRRILALIGGDRVAFMQGMVTNNVAALTDGTGCRAALLTIQGRLVSDLCVYAAGDRLLLDVPAGRAEAVHAALDRLIIADDVEFDTDTVQPLVTVEGPGSAALLDRLASFAVGDLSPYQHRAMTIDGIALRCVAIAQSGEMGFRLLGAPETAGALWQRLRVAGATPVGIEALNVLRLEAGIPWHGVDMDEETLVMEVGLDDAISFSKGCYLGQEVVERVAARGHVNRKLCGLVVAGSPIPPANTPLRHDGKEAGHLTSAVLSPALGKIIALGYVHRSAFEVGTVLQAEVGGTPLVLTVTALPFYRRAGATTVEQEGIHA
jgi:folate-binding protein YgfZ